MVWSAFGAFVNHAALFGPVNTIGSKKQSNRTGAAGCANVWILTRKSKHSLLGKVIRLIYKQSACVSRAVVVNRCKNTRGVLHLNGQSLKLTSNLMAILITALFVIIAIIGLSNTRNQARGKALSITCSLLLILVQIYFFAGSALFGFAIGGLELVVISGLLTILIFVPRFLKVQSAS